ncbi:MAG: ribonuclease E/G [Verrucomicrobiales bacterium]|nr:ribonuclease E/G [Verrucomicrobiales bacterium]|tara:strand:- start:1972 stop:4035 length:2064 start_codon:yes stop_codon:yes gene_type:complete
MAERKFGNNRRRSQRFKPSGGGNNSGGGSKGSGENNKGNKGSAGRGGGNRGGGRGDGRASAKQRRKAQNARALATGEKDGEERIFNKSRENEIVRSENVAAGLPPEVEKKKNAKAQPPPADKLPPDQKDFDPVELKEKPKGIVDSLKKTANKVIKKVKKLIKDEPKIHKEVIINYESLETRVAVLENGKLEEFNIERANQERMAGSIYKGRIKNLEDGLKAAFVDIGYEKNAFLHYWDIVPSNLDSSVEVIDRDEGKGGKKRRRERPKITQKDIPTKYPKGTEIIVQVTKGPIGTKGPRVTTHLAIPGRYLVLLPNSDQCGISRKIDDPEERKRLKKILRELDIPEKMGVIIRTVGEGQQKRYFIRDLALLMDEWKKIEERINNQKAATTVFQEPELVERTVRDFLTEDVERIVIDDHKKFEEVQSMIGKISRRSIDKVKQYAESQPIFDRFGIQRQLHNAFSRQVHLKSGGYLVIDETEALVAIDINTGSHKGKDDEKDKTILRVNEESADEICRLLRLRNLGGLIIIDFIDMRASRDQRAIFNRMRNNLKRDRAKTHVLPISQLGLMEMTRQRHSESVQTNIYDACGNCKGRGLVKNAMTMSVEVQRKMAAILKKRQRDESDFQLRVIVNPAVMERFKKEDEQILIDMEKKFFGKLTFRSDPNFHIEQFKIINGISNEELASVGF